MRSFDSAQISTQVYIYTDVGLYRDDVLIFITNSNGAKTSQPQKKKKIIWSFFF